MSNDYETFKLVHEIFDGPSYSTDNGPFLTLDTLCPLRSKGYGEIAHRMCNVVGKPSPSER